MTPRMNIFKAAPAGVKALMSLEDTFANSGLEHSLMELVKLRASQINGCAFCIHMHAGDAMKHGESPMRIHLLDAWRESPLYSDRERAALNWTEALTRLAAKGASDDDYARLESQFSGTEIGYLTLLIATINLWNRIQIGLRAVHPVEAPAAAA